MPVEKLHSGQRCPTCGSVVQAPLHACHAIRDNYAVREEPETEGPHYTWPTRDEVRAEGIDPDTGVPYDPKPEEGFFEIVEPDGGVCAVVRARTEIEALSRYAMSEGFADPRDVEQDIPEMSAFVRDGDGGVLSMVVTNYEVRARRAMEPITDQVQRQTAVEEFNLQQAALQAEAGKIADGDGYVVSVVEAAVTGEGNEGAIVVAIDDDETEGDREHDVPSISLTVEGVTARMTWRQARALALAIARTEGVARNG